MAQRLIGEKIVWWKSTIVAKKFPKCTRRKRKATAERAALTKVNTGLAAANDAGDFISTACGRLLQGGDGVLHGITFGQLGKVFEIRARIGHVLLHVVTEALIPKADEGVSSSLNVLSDATSRRVGRDHDDGLVGTGGVDIVVVIFPHRPEGRRRVAFGDDVERGHVCCLKNKMLCIRDSVYAYWKFGEKGKV